MKPDPLDDLMSALEDYLNHPSTDGSVQRVPKRKKLKELMEELTEKRKNSE